MVSAIKKSLFAVVACCIMAVSGCDNGVDAPDNTTDPTPEDPVVWSLSGTVACGIKGLQGVSVNVSQGDTVVAMTLTGSVGEFIAENLSDGTYTVTPFKEGYTFTPSSLEVAISGADSDSGTFTAIAEPGTDDPEDPDPVWSLGGAVLYNGSGLSGVTVSISHDDALIAVARTGAGGKYTADNLEDGTYTIVPSRDGYTFDPESIDVVISGADSLGRNFTASESQTPVETKWSLGGYILDDGGALSGVSVSIRLGASAVASVQTNSLGYFQAGNLSAGAYTVTPSRQGYSFDPVSRAISLSGADNLNVNFSATADSDPGTGGTVKLVCVGDINYGHFVEEVIQDPAIGDGDYDYPLLEVADYLESADITFGNLESMISDQGSDTKDTLTDLGYGLSLRAAPGALDGLLFAGFDVLNLANNHVGDFDYEAMEDCVNRLNTAGISHVGVGKNYADAHKAVIKEVNGTKIAFLGYSNVPMYADATGTSPTRKWIALGTETGDSDRWGLAWASDYRFDAYGDFDAMQNDVRNAKAQADIVIVSIHFGWEYAQAPDTNDEGNTPLTEQKKKAQQVMAHMAIDAGASLVVGHHPHVVQWLDTAKTTAIENYNGGYIAYSLGNFLFDISSERDATSPHGLLLNVTIDKGAIESIQQVKTHYHDDYWQTHFDE